MIWSWLLACGGSPDPCNFGDALPSCDVADACFEEVESMSAPRADCVDGVAWSEWCREEAFAELGDAGVLYAGDLFFLERFDTPTFTITDASTWATFVEAWPTEYGPPRPATPDFAESLVVVVVYGQESTCGLGLVRHGVLDSGTGAIGVYAEWEDSSGSCGDVCDMGMQSAAIYAVPRERGWPDVCTRVLNVCE